MVNFFVSHEGILKSPYGLGLIHNLFEFNFEYSYELEYKKDKKFSVLRF